MTEIEVMEPQSSAAAYQRTIKKKLKPGAIHNRQPGNRPLTVCFWTAFMSRVVTFLRRCAWSLLLVLPSLIAAGNTAGGCRVHADIGQSLAPTPMAAKWPSLCWQQLPWCFDWWEQSISSSKMYWKNQNGSRWLLLLSSKWGHKQYQEWTISTTIAATRTITSTVAIMKEQNNNQQVWSNRYSLLLLHPQQFDSKSQAIL